MYHAIRRLVTILYWTTSDVPKWNSADIPITDNEWQISADADSWSDIQLGPNFQSYNLTVNFVTIVKQVSNFGHQYTFCNIANGPYWYFWLIYDSQSDYRYNSSSYGLYHVLHLCLTFCAVSHFLPHPGRRN